MKLRLPTVLAVTTLLSLATATAVKAQQADHQDSEAPKGDALPQAPTHPFPEKLTLVVVHDGSPIATLKERVASWFPPSTNVEVRFAPQASRAEMFTAPDAQEAVLWILQLSAEKALVTFSVADDAQDGRYLVRDVRLEHGLDDLGLERLAYIIHSGVTALGDGIVGTKRRLAERQLELAGGPSAPSEPPNSAPLASTAENDSEAPRATGKAAPTRTSVPHAEATSTHDTPSRLPVGPQPHRRLEPTLATGYGVRSRGQEALGHGPLVEFGARLPQQNGSYSLALSGQWLFPSTVDAGVLEAELQTTLVRLAIAWEHRLSPRWLLSASCGGGVDRARIRPLTDHTAETTAGVTTITASSAGVQLRPAVDAKLGLFYRTRYFDTGVFSQTSMLLTDVRYSIATQQGESRLLTAQRLQPGVAVQVRFLTRE